MADFPTLELVSGHRAEFMFDKPGQLDILWSPDTPTDLTKEQIATYQNWRNTCIQILAAQTGLNIAVVDV